MDEHEEFELQEACSSSFVVIVESLSRVSLCDAIAGSTLGFPVLKHLPEFAQDMSFLTFIHQHLYKM